MDVPAVLCHGRATPPQMDSCLRCHDQPIEMPGRPTIPSVRDQIEGKKHVHGPLAQGNCSACHEPHATDHWRLLKDEFPSQFYTPYAKERYDLCFQCHDSALVEEEETRFATRFRDGLRNLHTVHVRRDQKVLVHSAAGGCGTFGVGICLAVGAEPIPVVGSERKKKTLMERFPGIAVRVPPSVVLGTDVFDEFLDSNDLRDFAIETSDLKSTFSPRCAASILLAA